VLDLLTSNKDILSKLKQEDYLPGVVTLLKTRRKTPATTTNSDADISTSKREIILSTIASNNVLR
jgi:hypothetical protein